MIPLAGLVGLVDGTAFWQNVATVFGAAAVWAQQRARPDADPVAELMFRLRHPVRHAAAHPIVTLRRKIDRRQSMRG
jgi:hypothetical protein